MSLYSDRRDVADDAFENYNFLEANVITTGSWEFTDPGTKWTKSFQLEDQDGKPIHGHFSVEFEATDSSRIAIALATVKGNDYGMWEKTTSSPGL